MKFILEVYPDLDDTDPPGELLRFAIDAIGGGPLAWDIVNNEGFTIHTGVLDMSDRVLGPNDERWIGHPRADVPPTDVQFSDQEADRQIDWFLRAVTAAGADVNQRRYDLEQLAEILTEHKQAGYGRMPLDTDVHGTECIICEGKEDFSMNPPGISRDGHPFLEKVPAGAPVYVVDQAGATHVFLFEPHAKRFAADERKGGSEEVVEFTITANVEYTDLDALADYACSHGPEDTRFNDLAVDASLAVDTLAGMYGVSVPEEALDSLAHIIAAEVRRHADTEKEG